MNFSHLTCNNYLFHVYHIRLSLNMFNPLCAGGKEFFGFRRDYNED